ncbi:MAG: regulatory protein RecX [Lachnospiraceae bacterium]
MSIKTDEGKFQLYRGECKKFGLQEQMEVEPDLEKILQQLLRKRAKLRALHLLEKQDRTEYQLRSKLEEGEYPPPIIEDAIEYVKSYGYIDDLRYGRNYVEYRSKTDSWKKIRMDLKRKGISDEILSLIAEERQECTVDEDEQALQKLIHKRYSNWNWSDRAKRDRAVRYLYSKGFSYEQIQGAVAALEDEWQ